MKKLDIYITEVENGYIVSDNSRSMTVGTAWVANTIYQLKEVIELLAEKCLKESSPKSLGLMSPQKGPSHE